jgi:hypothetical protein
MIPLSSSNCSTTVVVVDTGTLSSADTALEPEPITVSKRAAVQATKVRRFDIFRTVTTLI